MGFSSFRRRVRKESGDSGGEPLTEIELSIPDMVCEGCAERLDAALHAIPGVRAIRSDVRDKRVHLRYEPAHVDVQQLRDAAASAGFRVVEADRHSRVALTSFLTLKRA